MSLKMSSTPPPQDCTKNCLKNYHVTNSNPRAFDMRPLINDIGARATAPIKILCSSNTIRFRIFFYLTF